MFERFTESFERCLMQRDNEVSRECSRSPLRDSSPGETRVTKFSSQEDSGPKTTLKVASVVRALSPGAAQTDCHAVFNEHSGDTLTLSLGATGEASVEYHAETDEKSRSCKRK